MVAADKLHATVGDIVVSILRTDEFVVVDLQSMLFPAAGLSYNMEKRQMSFRSVREIDLFHQLSSSLYLS